MGEHLSFIDFIRLANRDIHHYQRESYHLPDEEAYITCSYLLQQVTEKLLKSMILISGEYPAFTHDIAKLRMHCDKLNLNVPESITLIEDSLTNWEVSTRYDTGFEVDVKKFTRACIGINELIDYFNNNITVLLPDENRIYVERINIPSSTQSKCGNGIINENIPENAIPGDIDNYSID